MCGIFGIINHHKRLLDKRAFITLGCANDSRGGDACGIMIDRKVEKGTEKDDQYFQCWYPKSKVLAETEKCYVALGHCRKASVGGVAPDKAQPVTIYDNEGNIVFCVIHNGTIYNYKELAEKYIPDVKIDGLTDSQVMAHIFCYKGYDVLAEYNGGGAFVIHDYRSNRTFLFKGESKGTLNAVHTEVERPLYYVQTGKSVIFSSIYAVLQGLYWGFEAYDVPSNVLLMCDGLALYKIKEYDRSECYGCKKTITHATTTTYPMNYAGSGHYVLERVDFDTFSGLYYNTKTSEQLHGIVYVSKYGYISKYATAYNHPYYFWNGIMLSGENAYNAVRNMHAEKNHSDSDLMNLARRLSCNPVCIRGKYYSYNVEFKKELFSNAIHNFYLTTQEFGFDDEGCIDEESELPPGDGIIYPAEISEKKVTEIVNYVKTGIQRNKK